jgi:hypothetical protein
MQTSRLHVLEGFCSRHFSEALSNGMCKIFYLRMPSGLAFRRWFALLGQWAISGLWWKNACASTVINVMCSGEDRRYSGAPAALERTGKRGIALSVKLCVAVWLQQASLLKRMPHTQSEC